MYALICWSYATQKSKTILFRKSQSQDFLKKFADFRFLSYKTRIQKNVALPWSSSLTKYLVITTAGNNQILKKHICNEKKW